MNIGEKIKGIGEVVIRVSDMESCIDFYRNIVGLKLLNRKGEYAFFKITDGYSGHHQILALFDKSIPNAFNSKLDTISVSNSSLHHVAMEIDKKDYQDILNILAEKNIDIRTETFEWAKWKSIFIKDPESNVVEFVCYDPSL